MQATEATDVPGSDESTQRRRSSPRSAVSVLFAIGILVAAAGLSMRLVLAATTVSTALLVLALVALLLGAGLWWSGRRAAVTAVPESSAPEESAAEPTGAGADDSTEGTVMSPRVLGAYVRTLEATLAEQDDRLHECRRAADLRVEEQQQRDRDRVRLTLLALRDAVGDQPGAVALNRVEQALERLHQAPALTRPLLAARPSGSPGVRFAVPQRVPVDDEPAPSTPTEPAAAPERPRVGTTMLQEIFDLVDAPSEAPSDGPDPEDPVPSTPLPAEVQRVLPVPAPPEVAARGRRTRRRLRRRAAVSSP